MTGEDLSNTESRPSEQKQGLHSECGMQIPYIWQALRETLRHYEYAAFKLGRNSRFFSTVTGNGGSNLWACTGPHRFSLSCGGMKNAAERIVPGAGKPSINISVRGQ